VEVISAFRKHLGDDDPATLDVETWLVRNLSLSSMNEPAKMGAGHLYAACRRVNGPDHKDTLWVERLLATLGDRNDGRITYQPWEDEF
jgi:hypothetical protein